MKRPFSLMEILVGLSLASIVLGMLFTSLYETSMVSSRLDRAERVVLGRAELQQRLDGVFGTLINSSERQTPLYLKKDGSLHLTFRCGIDPDPRFSDELSGFLRLEEKNFLFQVTGNALPGRDAAKERVEILKEGVERVSYEFLSYGELTSSWEKEREIAPAYIKLILHLKDEKREEYVFWVNKEPEGVPIR